MGFKISQQRGDIGFGVTSHGIQDFPTTGDIGFGVTSHGIQDFPTTGDIGFGVTSHGIQDFPTAGGHWVWGNQPWDSRFPNNGGTLGLW